MPIYATVLINFEEMLQHKWSHKRFQLYEISCIGIFIILKQQKFTTSHKSVG